jgi:hypothetical protein
MTSMAMILCPLVVKSRTTRGRPPGIQTAAAAPLRSAGLAPWARCEKAATCCAPRVSGCAQLDGVLVGAEDDVGVEEGEQRVEVAVSGCGEEGINECGLAEPVCLLGRVLLLRAFRAGANLAPDRAVGLRTWEEFLADRVSSSGDSRSKHVTRGSARNLRVGRRWQSTR